MFIEEILKNLADLGGTNRFDKTVVDSLNFQVNILGNGFTEKQSDLVLKILKRYSGKINASIQQDISQFLDNPKFRYPIRASTAQVNRISVIDHPEWVKAIKLEFPYNEEIVNFIRIKKESLGEYNLAVWSKELKAWIFTLSEASIQLVKEILVKKEFEIDQSFEIFLNQFDNIACSMETFVPMLIIENNIPRYQNVPSQVPPLTSTDWLNSLFEARKSGISVWDQTLDNFLKSEKVDKIVYDFLTNDPAKTFDINSRVLPLDSLKNIVKYLEPGIFVIPGGSEIEKIQLCYYFLKSMNVDDSEISVLFRLPSDTHKNFNDFVKNHGLNNPLSEKTRYVFISSKVPKTIFGAKLNFHSIIGFGEHYPHHTLRELTKNSENCIVYKDTDTKKGSKLAFL